MTDGDILGQNALGMCHITINVGPPKEEVERLTQRLKEEGYQGLDSLRTTGDGYYESCVDGLDGNLIEITTDKME